jgi:hypothetical protein
VSAIAPDPLPTAAPSNYLSAVVMLVVGTGGRVELGARPVVIGSAASCDLVVPSAELTHVRIVDSIIEAIAPCRVGKVPLNTGERRTLLAGCAIEVGGEVLRTEEKEASGVTTRDLALDAVANAARSPRVVVVQGPAMGMELALEEGRPCTVGRSDASDLDLGADDTVSRLHLEMVRRGKEVLARDLGSAAGTFLGRARLDPHRAVVWTPERMIQIGASVLGLDVPWWLRPMPAHEQPSRQESAQEQGLETPNDEPSVRSGVDMQQRGPSATMTALPERPDFAAVVKPRQKSRLASYVFVGLLLLVVGVALVGLAIVLFM